MWYKEAICKIWMPNDSCIKILKINAQRKGKICKSSSRNESEYFLMCCERHIKVNRSRRGWGDQGGGASSELCCMMSDWQATRKAHLSPWPLLFTSPCRPSASFSSSLCLSERPETRGGGTSRVKRPQAATCSKGGVTGKQRPFR